MTSWETVDNLKTQNESMILQLKESAQTEIRKAQEQSAKEIGRLEDQLIQARQDGESAREKLVSSEAANKALRDNLATQRESMLLQIKEASQGEVRKIQAQTSREILRLEDQLSRMKRDADVAREKLASSEFASADWTTQHQSALSQLKESSQAELQKIREQNSREISRLEDQLGQLNRDLDAAREKLLSSEADKQAIREAMAACQKELSLKVRFWWVRRFFFWI